MNSTLPMTSAPSSDPHPVRLPASADRAQSGGERPPRVSIGLNCYKAERWIGECLDSLLAQTLQDFEIVISDNASPDSTFEICQSHAARDPRIRAYRTDRNVGIAGNLNRVFELARGEFFCWASANDYYAPQFLERCVRRMQDDPEIDLVASQPAPLEQDPPIAEPDPRDIEVTMHGPADRVVALLRVNRDGRFFRGVYRRAALLPLMPLGTRFGQDIVLGSQLAANGKVVMLGERHYYFERTAPGTVTHRIPAHLRVGYYEPEAGLRAYLFHRCRNQFEIWRIALRAADTGREKLRAALGMLRLSYRWKSDVYHDLYDVAGLIRGYLRARRKSIRPA